MPNDKYRCPGWKDCHIRVCCHFELHGHTKTCDLENCENLRKHKTEGEKCEVVNE